MPDDRVFLTRMQATHMFGLMDASLKREPVGVKVACQDQETLEVFEALPGEFLHAQIACRVRTGHAMTDGWTVPLAMMKSKRDVAFEKLVDEIASDMSEAGITAEDALMAWKIGRAAVASPDFRVLFRRAVQDVVRRGK